MNPSLEMNPERLYCDFTWIPTGERQNLWVREGKVIERGPNVPAPEGVERISLKGKWVLPRFVDAHCHILPAGLDLLRIPVEDFTSRNDLLEHLRECGRDLPEGQWLVGVHYDQNRFSDGLHLTRTELDQIAGDRPAILRHSSGHASVANSAALQAAGVAEDEKDPQGGAYVRDASGRLSGVLLEAAHERVISAVPKPSFDEAAEAICAAAESMGRWGIGRAADMMTGERGLEFELEAYKKAIELGAPVRIRLYVLWSKVFGPKGIGARAVEEINRSLDPSRLRIAGVKIFADGAISSGTAAIYGRFGADPSAENEPTNEGVLMYPPERLHAMIREAHEAGLPLAIHSIGDRSTDLVMDAFEQLGDASAHRIEHAMMLSDRQIERLARIGCRVTMQPEFLVRIGHAYQRQLGPERTSRLKRCRSVVDAGLRLSLNSDRPVVQGDPWVGVYAASQRPEGFDPAENLSLEESIAAYTAAGAEACGDDGQLGAGLLPGQWAEMQVYDQRPAPGYEPLPGPL